MKPKGAKSRNVHSGAGGDRAMAIPKTITREALNLLSPRILKLAPRFRAQFEAELAELAELGEDDWRGVVARFEKWNDMLTRYFRESVKRGRS
jgi:hypothetical protein